MREVFTAFSLLLVVGIAEVMSYAGLSMALGAFIAGVLLASSEYRRALETDIEPFKGLLLGLFFIGVGMSIDFGQVIASPLLLALIVFGLIAIKFAVLVGIAKPLGVPRKQRLAFGALLGQGGEFAFVVFSVASASQGARRSVDPAADRGRRDLDGRDADRADRRRPPRRARGPQGARRRRHRRTARRSSSRASVATARSSRECSTVPAIR